MMKTIVAVITAVAAFCLADAAKKNEVIYTSFFLYKNFYFAYDIFGNMHFLLTLTIFSYFIL